MSKKEFKVSRRGGEGDSPVATLKAQVEAEIAAAIEQATVELAEAPVPSDWEIWAVGPWQDPGLAPSRIIALGEKAYIVTIVFMNPFMEANVTGFRGKIQLNYFTSNMQTMKPVGGMDYSCCIETGDPDLIIPGLGVFYVRIWEFEPTQAACILSTNICARVCNCDDEVVPGYAAFCRWIANLDFDAFFPPLAYQVAVFDHPVRFLVYDNDDDTNCECLEDCVSV